MEKIEIILGKICLLVICSIIGTGVLLTCVYLANALVDFLVSHVVCGVAFAVVAFLLLFREIEKSL